MQIEVLKFLLDAQSHLQTAPKDRHLDTGHLDDLQAVDRALPDCDWFEVGEEPPSAGRNASEPLAEWRTDLEF